ncbi:hypothetical protein DV515_00006862 [Chloebia gouldiae]|uniref:Uncharacterized protein n=1 Tax=Chloebia gouldiae TaxID=44316 RepID=A0A3L8SKG6_CHLGU|nr:hypothetical protein DV515_00006862 [Chloebia gouldiae]
MTQSRVAGWICSSGSVPARLRSPGTAAPTTVLALSRLLPAQHPAGHTSRKAVKVGTQHSSPHRGLGSWT